MIDTDQIYSKNYTDDVTSTDAVAGATKLPIWENKPTLFN